MIVDDVKKKHSCSCRDNGGEHHNSVRIFVEMTKY